MNKLFLILILNSFIFGLDLQKAKKYEQHDNIKNWVMSEKLDGIRAYWNTKELLTRKGNKIHAPKWFIKNLPDFELDGELWTKRDDFENIQSIVMDKKPSKKWKEITYNIFEVPHQKGDFLSRLQLVQKYIEKEKLQHIKVIKQIKIKDKTHLKKFMEEVTNKKGEGVIVKNPTLNYFCGRSSNILKVKNFSDMEGEVIGINMSKKTGVLKSLKVKLENGTTFNLGTGFTKVQREKSFKVGTIVSFKYYGFTKNGKPKFASFLRVRKD
ncbi:DNA ligase [Arcobacter sp. CECT 8983]|uniref:DNA ligase n=1 Tax=Arcobacter sp. CECT 8983 TaxID=2044508 RepID=UPI00100BCA86|nr:DNA ligase [Arcobacter sp. CECT 8983]RXJ90620.1 DNA ligase [Arcobacter sp. CECT 8983]